MLGSQIDPFYLQSQPLLVHMARPNNLPLLMRSNIQEPMLKQPLNAPQHILDLEWRNFRNIKFLMHYVIVLFSYCIGGDRGNFVLRLGLVF